jgi:hypothetical protein
VRVYANLEGMANYLVRLDKVRNLGQLRAFSTGFCGRITSFDWIDTGVGKEGGAGRKVRGMYLWLLKRKENGVANGAQKTCHSSRPTRIYGTR